MDKALKRFLDDVDAHMRATQAIIEQAKANARAAGANPDDLHAFAVYCKRTVREKSIPYGQAGHSAVRWLPEQHALWEMAAECMSLDSPASMMCAPSARWLWFMEDMDDEGPIPPASNPAGKA